MTPAELEAILVKHKLWLRGDPGGEHANLRRANLTSADLTGADLRDANLTCANLENANLTGADLTNADLTCANLECVNLKSVNLECVNLECVNLECVNLRRANLTGACLTGACLSGANLERVRGVTAVSVTWPGHGECGRQLLAVRNESGTTYYCGCFSGTRNELLRYIKDGKEDHKPSRTLTLDVVDILLAASGVSK